MENRLDRVHISYKNDDAHEEALKAVIAGLEKNNIAYSIDRYDILYGDSIDKYEEEIGASDRIIMFVIPPYFKSIECMYEMTQMFLNGKVRERIICLVDMEGIQRNGDGLGEIKDYWQGEKARKAQRMVNEPGGSRFISMEIRKIDGIIRTLDDLWFFICRDSTGNYKKWYYTTYNRTTGKALTYEDIIKEDKDNRIHVLLARHLAAKFEFHSVTEYIDSLNAWKNSLSNYWCENKPSTQSIGITVWTFPTVIPGLINEGLIFTYPRYSIAPGICGVPYVVLSYGEVEGSLKVESKEY